MEGAAHNLNNRFAIGTLIRVKHVVIALGCMEADEAMNVQPSFHHRRHAIRPCLQVVIVALGTGGDERQSSALA